MLQLAIFALVATGTGALLTAAFYSRLVGDREFRHRLDAITGFPRADARDDQGADELRRRSVEAALRGLEEKQKARARRRGRTDLLNRMRQAGVTWTRTTYFMVAAAVGAVCFLAAFGLGLGPLAALGFGAGGGLVLPHSYVSLLRKRRFKACAAEFPNALDVIVRGVKTGLPLLDCLKTIAAGAQEPLRREFQTVIEDQTLGLPLEEAVQRLVERVPIAEANFFAIVIAIQSRSGGSLSGALGNLSAVLRERKKMAAKIKAMSQEAKSSAAIIAALPVVVGVLVYLTSPDYITLLFTTMTGNAVVAASGLWMLVGVLVMRKMINFDF